jgi:hypothetical protein
MSNPKLYVIEAQDMPTQGYSLTIKEPLFADRREASKRVPVDKNIGYSVDQLLLSMCIYGVNGKAIPPAPRDPIYKLKDLPTDDGQFVLQYFLGAFSIDEDLADEIKAFCDSLKGSTNSHYTIPSHVFPSGERSITFKTITSGEQFDQDRVYPGEDSGCGYSLEELLFASAIVEVDNKAVDKQKIAIDLLNEWPLLDVSVGLAIFLNICYIDKEQKKKARELGKLSRTKPAESKEGKRAKSRITSGITTLMAEPAVES